MRKRVRVFLNAKSGPRRTEQARLRDLFATHDCDCTISELRHLARFHQSDPVEVPFIAAGGDGTVNLVAAIVAGTRRSLGIVAVGTLNHFARDLGLPLELEAAVRVAACGLPRIVDAAEVNGLLFVNNSSLGVYPAMVIDRDRMTRGGRNKWTSLVAASARAFIRFRCLTIDLVVDGKARTCTTPFLFVGNNVYCLEGARIGRRERLDQGQLALYLTPGANRISMLRLFAAAVLGRIKQDPTYQEFNVEQFTVRARKRRLRVSFDGEVRRLDGPLHYASCPGILNVLCPTEEAE